MDEGFFKRVVVTGIIVAVIVAMMVWTWVGKGAALAFGAAVIISMGIFQGTIMFADALIRPPDERKGRGSPTAAVHVVKYGVAGFLMWLCIVHWHMNVWWFAGGLGFPLVIMFLKLAGQAAMKREAERDGE